MNYIEDLTNKLYRVIGSGKMYGLKYNSFQSVYYLLQQLKKAPKVFTFDLNAQRELNSPELSAFLGYHIYITGYIHVDVYNDYEVRTSHSSVPFPENFWETMKEIAKETAQYASDEAYGDAVDDKYRHMFERTR